MGRWRSKLLLTLIVYAAGFATAIYVVAPPQASEPDSEPQAFTISQWTMNQDLPTAGFEATPWVETAHAAFGKAVAFAKDQSVVLAEAINAKVEQNKRDRDH